MLPLNSLDNVQIRNALVEHVIRPHVFQARRRVEAFRVIWRKNGAQALDSAWNHIHHWRQDCDDIIRAVGNPSCLFFFSAVTGLYNKSKARTVAAYCDIYPAISYYVVLLLDSSLSFVDFAAPVMSRFPDAQTKQILSHSDRFDPDLRYLSAPLFAALKDCSSSFVRDKIERSTSSLQLSAASGEIGATAVAKLVVTKPDLVQAMSHAYASIMEVAPYLELQIVF